MNYRYLLLPLATLALTQCIVVDENGNVPGTSNPGTATQLPGRTPGFTQPLTVTSGPGMVTIREGNRTLSAPRTAMPNVEETRWYNEQEQLVVKSRANHGPATVQLFDSRTGRQEGTVMAYELSSGGPAWAKGMAE